MLCFQIIKGVKTVNTTLTVVLLQHVSTLKGHHSLMMTVVGRNLLQ